MAEGTISKPVSLLRHALVFAAALVLAWLAVAVGVANSFRSIVPDLALQWWPWDARAKANLAQRRLAQVADPAVRSSQIALLHSSLARDPTYAPAVRTLALVRSADADLAQIRRFMQLSARLSRRDLPTRLWLIEERVRANDIAGALQHYDMALRTSESAKEVLFPVLISASAQPHMVEPLAQLLARRQRWTEVFLPRLFAQAPSPATLVQIIEGMARRGTVPPRELMQSVVDQLGGQHRFDLAWRAYRVAGNTDGARRTIRNGDFGRDNVFPPIDWLLSTDPQLAVAVEDRPGGDPNPALGFEIGPAASGRIAWQLQGLPAGAYRLSAEAGGLPLGADLHWIVFCGGERPAPLLDYRLPVAANAAPHSAQFRIPEQGCESQVISLVVMAGGRSDGSRGWIDSISLTNVPG